MESNQSDMMPETQIEKQTDEIQNETSQIQIKLQDVNGESHANSNTEETKANENNSIVNTIKKSDTSTQNPEVLLDKIAETSANQQSQSALKMEPNTESQAEPQGPQLEKHEPLSEDKFETQSHHVERNQQHIDAAAIDNKTPNKKLKVEAINEQVTGILNANGDVDGPPPVAASKLGITSFNDYDVLSGRGGGTNVHPGNRNFRDLINLHRRAYLKARKNDKPAISRAIVRSVRENNGRFLKKDEKTGSWFEVGDDAAREKTSQALRQRAPEMRKLLFDTEREEARAAAEEQLRQQRMMMAGNVPMAPGMHNGMAMGPGGQTMFPNPALFQAMVNGNKNAMQQVPNMQNVQDPYALHSQMFSAALQGMNNFGGSNGV